MSAFGAIKGKRISLGGKNSIVESKKSSIYDQKLFAKDIYNHISRAEIKIASLKNEDTYKQQDSEDDLKPFDENDEMAKMYRMILNEEPNEDARKTHYEIMREVYSHTENKQDVSRNMLATLFVRDPAKFRGE